jgi:hypothetical protein
MTKNIKIVSASVGCIAQHYDGRRSIVFRSRWKAQLCAEILGAGWFVRDLLEPLFVVEAKPDDVVNAR